MNLNIKAKYLIFYKFFNNTQQNLLFFDFVFFFFSEQFSKMKSTKLSQTHVNNLAKFQQKLQQLNKIQAQMYERIIQNQKNTMSQLQIAKSSRQKCLKQRQKNIRAQTFEQIIKHPVNGEQKGGNGCWMYLANFIQERHDLDEVQKRMLERQKIREDLERVKREEREKEEMRLQKQQRQRQEREGINDGKGSRKGRKGNSSRKIPFNLQRELHKKEVEDNRRRMEKIQQYKKQEYLRSHNFY